MFKNLINKRILVTGHTGFKGSWLVKMLYNFTSHIFGFALKPKYENSMYEICQIANCLENEYYDLDISDCNSISKCISEVKPNIIFHLAAQPLVLESYEDPMTTFHTNVDGTLNLLEAIRCNLKKCTAICITTDKVYENNEHGCAFKEDDKLCGYDPYSASKVMCELLVDSYRKSYFNASEYGKSHMVQVATCRAGNVIGGGDFSKNRIMVDIVEALHKHQTITLRNPKAVRPWQHVLEPLYGYMMLADRLESGFCPMMQSAFNFGPLPRQQTTVEDLVKEAVKLLGSGKYAVDSNAHLHEAQRLVLDISKAERCLGWVPILDIDTTLQMTLDWYRTFFNGGNCIDMTNKQMSSYLTAQQSAHQSEIV